MPNYTPVLKQTKIKVLHRPLIQTVRQAFYRNCKELVITVDFLHKGMCKRCDFVTIEPTEQADQLTDRACNVPVKILADAPWSSGADVVKAAFRNKISSKTHHVTSFVRNFMVNVTSNQTANLKLATDKPQPRQRLRAACHAGANEALLRLAAAKCIIDKN